MPIGTGAAILGSALIGGGASLFAANKQSNAAAKAAQQQQQALAYQRQVDERNQANLAPYLGIGQQATGKLGELMGGNMGSFFESPDYKFRFNEGMRGLENSAAARGGLLSGNFLRGATDYGQKAASSEFGNYFTRLMENARLGQNSAVGAGSLGVQSAGQYGQTSGQLGNTLMAQGAAQASGPVGAANAITGGMQNYLFMNALQNRPGSIYSGSQAIGGYGNSMGQYNPNVPGGFLGYS